MIACTFLNAYTCTATLSMSGYPASTDRFDQPREDEDSIDDDEKDDDDEYMEGAGVNVEEMNCFSDTIVNANN